MNMTLYDLEGRINEYIKEHELDNAEKNGVDNFYIGSTLAKIVKEIIGEDYLKEHNIEVYGWTTGEGQLIRLQRKQLCIYIEYKRTRYTRYNSIWSSYAVYGLKSVEVYHKDSYKDLEDFIEQDEKINKDVVQKHNEEYEKIFENIGVNFYKGGFTLKELCNFKYMYNKLTIAEKKEICNAYNNGEFIDYI